MTDTTDLEKWPFTYRIHGRFFGQKCRLVKRGGKNTIMIEFAEGLERIVFCSGWAIRKRSPAP